MALVKAQRQMGHQATAMFYTVPWVPVAGSVDLNRVLVGTALNRKVRRVQVLAHLAAHFDVFHFHYVGSFFRSYADLAVLKALGKIIVFHLHGCDIRNPGRVRIEHEVSACAECPAQCLTPAKIGLPSALRRYVDAVIVSTPDLLEFVPEAQYIPNPVDVTIWDMAPRHRSAPQLGQDDWIVVHAPTDRAIKGTRHIEAAVEALRAEGMSVRLRLLEGLTHEELRQACVDADIVVDQVLVGWFGLFALEMMALGKPVVAYIREDLQVAARDIPLASAGPLSLLSTLRGLTASAAWRHDLELRGPRYVRQHHDPLTVARQILGVYEQHGSASKGQPSTPRASARA